MPQNLDLYPDFPVPFPETSQWPEYHGIQIPPPGTFGRTIAKYHYEGFEIGTPIVVGNAYRTCNGFVYLNFFRHSFLRKYLERYELRSPDELGEWITRQYHTGNFAGIRIAINPPDNLPNPGWQQTLQLEGPSIIYEQSNLNRPRVKPTGWLRRLLKIG